MEIHYQAQGNPLEPEVSRQDVNPMVGNFEILK